MNSVQSLLMIQAMSCVCSWDHQPTTGEPPLGVMYYSCASIGHDIFYLGGYCGHDGCRHNSLNVLNVDKFTWKELFPTSDIAGPMRKDGCGMLAFHDALFTVGGVGVSFPIHPSPSATYEKYSGMIYTNENHIYDREGG